MEKEQTENDAKQRLVAEVAEQFVTLQGQRKLLERQWELNLNFVTGNQYCRIAGSGEIVATERTFEWEQRRVFNHIAPIIDTRLSKLSRIRPALAVRAASDSEEDKNAARLASVILSAVQDETDMDGVISEATMWSEICGTAFYKVVWDSAGGKTVGRTQNGGFVHEGGASVSAVSPFEIYPFSLSESSVEGQEGIIHAKILPVETIRALYGVETGGRPLNDFYVPGSWLKYADKGENRDTCGNFELVIERYLRAGGNNPNGRLTIIAGENLLYDGELPYINGEDGGRQYPFIKQISVPVAGGFFGSSVVDRLIPVQRAFNAVKNRKHEYLNRISMGTVAVEEGSVDVDSLVDEGLAPGKVIVYRQGAKPPEMLTLGSVPEEFWKEEESLLAEFTKISGTGDLSENADSFAGVTSATGLQLIIDQDDARLNVAYGSLKRALRAIGKQILRLYRQFASETRLVRYSEGEDRVQAVCFKGSDISGDDVILEADTDLNLTPIQRRAVVFELLDKGLLTDENGRLPRSVKRKILDILGYSYLAEEIPAEEAENKNDN